MRSPLTMLLGACLLALASVPASAQSDPLGVKPDCELAPQPEGPIDVPEGVDPGPLTDLLKPCDGVLAPPATGDEEQTIMPPSGGETPVIPPEVVPEQPGRSE
jgi:hypothetical protein